MPEPFVEEDAQLAILGQVDHRLLLPDGPVALDVAADLGREYEEAAIDEAAVAARLFLKAGDAVALKIDGAEPARRLCCRHGRKSSLAAVESDAFGDVDIAYAVAVGQAEILVVTQIGQDLLDAAADHGAFAGIDQGDRPGFSILAQNVHLVFAQVESDVGLVQEVVREILLDHIALVAEADDEIVDAVAGVDFHDMPQDRLAADLDHRFGTRIGLFGKTGS